MAKAAVYGIIRAHSARTAPVFVLLALVLLAVSPFVLTNVNEIDENAIKQNSPFIDRSRLAYARWGERAVHWQRRRVRGRRADGAEVVAVYVNTDAPASVMLAGALVDMLQRSTAVSCDVQFYFVSAHTLPWPLPQTYARAALVLNVSSLARPHVCLDFFAYSAIQPNQDLVNAALRHATENGIDVNMLCPRTLGQVTRAPRAGTLHTRVLHALHLYDALVTAVQTELQPQPWHDIPRKKAISTLAIATPSMYAATPAAKPPHAAAHVAVATPDMKMDVAERLLLFVLQTVYALSALEERFHHSTFAWLPVDAREHVAGGVLQLVVLLLILSMAAVLYANYQPNGAAVSLVVVSLWCTPVLAASVALCTSWHTASVVVVSLCMAVALHRHTEPEAVVGWCFVNIVALALLFVVHLPMAVLGGGAAAVQILCLYPATTRLRRVALLAGTVVSWLLYAYLALHLHLSMLSVAGVCSLYTSLIVYANAVCVTGRCVLMLRTRKSCV